MAAQRLHMAAHGAAYGCSEATFGGREAAFCCTGAVYGSHAADMQYMLHLAGLGWQPGSREHAKLRELGGLGPLILHPGWGIKDQGSTIKDQGGRMLMNCRLKAAKLPRCKDVGLKDLLAAWWP